MACVGCIVGRLAQVSPDDSQGCLSVSGNRGYCGGGQADPGKSALLVLFLLRFGGLVAGSMLPGS